MRRGRTLSRLMTQSTVSLIWRAFGLQPHRTEALKLSTDPLFVEKVRDIVGLYLNPPEHALVLCVDEESQIQALDRTLPPAFASCSSRTPYSTIHTRRHESYYWPTLAHSALGDTKNVETDLCV